MLSTYAPRALHGATAATLLVSSVFTAAVSAQFSTASTYLNLPPLSVHTGDLSGDGRPEIVHANYTSALEIRVNNGAGAFPTFVTAGVSGARYVDARVFVADNAFGRDIAAVDNQNGRVDVLLDQGGLTFAPAMPIVVPAGPVGVIDFDLDGDGDRDLAVISATAQTLTIIRNLSGFVWMVAQTLPLGFIPTTVTAGRLGGDPLEDLVVVSMNASRVFVFENQVGTIAPPVAFGTDLRPWEAVVADFDNDGDNDLAVTSSASSVVDVFRNVTSGPITAATFAPFVAHTGGTATGLRGIDARDFDCDGFIDMVAAGATSASLGVFRNQAGLGFLGSSIPLSGAPTDLSLDTLGADWMPEPAVACSIGTTARGIVMFNFTKCGECWHTLHGGVADGFSINTAPLSETADPGVQLQSVMLNPRPFDGGGAVVNSDFGHTFTGLPPAIVSARLHMRLRAGHDRPDNDSLHLQLDSSGGFLWDISLPTLTNLPWTPFMGFTANVMLDLANLPGGGNLLASLNSTGRFDVYVQDDTLVDFARLEIVSQGLRCRHQFDVSTVRFLAGQNAPIQVTGALPNSLLVVGLGTALGIGPPVTFSGITWGDHCILGPVTYTALTGTTNGTATINLPIPTGPVPAGTYERLQVISMQSTPPNLTFSNTLTVPVYN